jgi:hypothetical protein
MFGPAYSAPCCGTRKFKTEMVAAGDTSRASVDKSFFGAKCSSAALHIGP